MSWREDLAVLRHRDVRIFISARFVSLLGSSIAPIALVFAVWYRRVLIGDRALIPGDILYLFPPMNHSPTAHAPHNVLIGDVIFEMYPWFQLVRDSLLHPLM